MKINLAATVNDFDGTPIQDGGKPLTIGRACVIAIGTGVNDDKTPESVIALYELGMRIAGASEVDITPEQAAMLKLVVAKALVSPLHSGQVCKALNG